MLKPDVYRDIINNQPPKMVGEPYGCLVTVNVAPIKSNISKIADIIINMSYKTKNPYEDHLAIHSLVAHAVNYHLELIFNNTVGVQNKFDNYLDEYFQSCSHVIKNDAHVISTINVLFLEVVEYLIKQLKTGVNNLHQNGYAVESVQTFDIQPDLNAYLIQGEGYENDLETSSE